MRYDDRYNDPDDDLWDDELDLRSGNGSTLPSEHPSDEDEERMPATNEDVSYEQRQTASPEEEPDAEYEDEEEEDYYSEPGPSLKTRLKSLFRRKKTEDDEDEEEYEYEDDGDNDFYDSDAEPEPVRRPKPRPPRLDPEDPDYWIQNGEDSPLSGIMPKRGGKWKWMLAAVFGLVLLILGSWIWFFRPYADNAVKYGYIKNMERRGSLIKTFEGSMIPYKEVGDPDPLYFEEVRFSVEGDSLAAIMKRMMLGCVPVRVEYEVYHAPLPWKGEERMIIIKADTADTRKILPPEYRHFKN